MKSALLFLAAFPALAQTIHITAAPQDRKVTTTAFGRFAPVVYDVDICSSAPLKIQTAQLRQKVQLPAGYSLLSSTEALMVIQTAQARQPLARATAILTGLSGAAGAAVAIKAVPVSGWGASVILGGELSGIVIQFLFPALSTHAVQNAPTLLPESLDFTAASCVAPAVALVSVPRKTVPGTLDLSVTVF